MLELYYRTLLMKIPLAHFIASAALYLTPGPILESKGMHATFQKKGKKRAKYMKIVKLQNLKIFLKRHNLMQ